MQLFGQILDISHDSATVVFVSVMFFLTCLEGVLHSVEHVTGKYGYKALVMKLYREFMILGFISFGIEITNVVVSFNHANKWFASFHFAHMVILFVGITFLLQSLLLVSLIAQRKRKLLYYDSCTSESLFVDYLQLFEHGYNYLKNLFNYGPVSIPLPELREKIEFKIIQEYFIRSYRLDPKFKFANYMCKVLKNYIISLVEVRPINWFSVAFLVALNYLRILLIDPYYESDVCDRYPRRLASSGEEVYHSIHICPDYTLRVVFVALIGITGYMLAVFISSEVYVQRLIGKVLDDEETLEWLDTEEAIEENRKFSSPFPHPLELLNQNETFAANEAGSKPGSALASAMVGVAPIDPTQATHQRMGSESGVLNSNSINNRRSSIRRSFSYKSPLNDANLHSEPVQEESVSAPPERGIQTRHRSITLNVPIHKENLPEASRGSIASYEETKAITAEINNLNRRHLYLKCLERIIQVEYSYHEHEARRTSIASEHEAHELGHYSTTPGRTPNTGRYKGSSIHSAGATAIPTISTRPESSSACSRIDNLKAMKMKDLRELMLQARQNLLKPEGAEAVNESEQQEPGGMRRTNSGLLFFASGGGGGYWKGSLISSVGGDSGKHKPTSDDIPKKFFDNPLAKKDNDDHSVCDVEMANHRPTTNYPDSRRGSVDSKGEVKRDYAMKFFEFVKHPPKEDKKSASTSIENIGNFYQSVSKDAEERTVSSSFESLPPQLLECLSVVSVCGNFVYIQLKRFAECFISHLFGIEHDHHDHNLKKLHTSTHHQHRGSHQRSLDDIKELEADFKAIFLWSNPSYYYLSVEFSLLLQCMYVALWATNFVFMAVNSHFVVLWNIALLLPMLLNFFLLKQIIFSSCLLQSIIKIDINIANRICENAIEERNVTHRLRRMIRDKLKEISPDRRYWKKILYDYYSLKMDDNEEINREEWKDFLYSLNLQLTNSSIRQLFKLIDTDQDGFIHWNDLYMIVFPDFMKKKIKIRKPKKNRKKKQELQEDAGKAEEVVKQSSGYSMEYHISEEDRMSYQKKTSSRSSLLTSTRRIRNSLVPRPSNNTLSPNSTGNLTRNTTVTSLQSSDDNNAYLAEEKVNDDGIIFEEPGSSKKSSNDHNDHSPIEERSLLSKTNRPPAAQLRKKTISFDDNLINYSPSQGNTSRPSSGSILRPAGLSITIDGGRNSSSHVADNVEEPHVPDTTSISEVWKQTNDILPGPSTHPTNTTVLNRSHRNDNDDDEQDEDEDEEGEEEEEEEDEEEALNQIRERARSRAHSRIIEDHHFPRHHHPPGSQPTPLQSYLNRKPSTPKFGMFKAFRKTFTKSKSKSIDEEEDDEDDEDGLDEDEDRNVSIGKDYFAEVPHLIRQDSAGIVHGGHDENNEVRRRSGSRAPRAYSFSSGIMEEKEDHSYLNNPQDDNGEEEEEEEEENSNASSLDDDDDDNDDNNLRREAAITREFLQQRTISSSSPHLRPSSLSNQLSKRISVRRSVGPDGIEFEEVYCDI